MLIFQNIRPAFFSFFLSLPFPSIFISFSYPVDVLSFFSPPLDFSPFALYNIIYYISYISFIFFFPWDLQLGAKHKKKKEDGEKDEK